MPGWGLRLYAKFNRRVTPELLNMRTYSIANYDEWARMDGEYNALANDTDALVLQKIIVNLGGLHKCYLGPEETLK